MGSQRVGHDWATELNWTDANINGLPRWLRGKKIRLSMQKMWVRSVGQKIPWRRKWQPTLVLLPRKIPWTEKPGGLQIMGCRRIRHDLETKQKQKMQIQFEKCSNLASIHLKVEETDLWISPEISVDRSGREKIKEYYGGRGAGRVLWSEKRKPMRRWRGMNYHRKTWVLYQQLSSCALPFSCLFPSLYLTSQTLLSSWGWQPCACFQDCEVQETPS